MNATPAGSSQTAASAASVAGSKATASVTGAAGTAAAAPSGAQVAGTAASGAAGQTASSAGKGAPVAGGGAAPSGASSVWSECRFHFGAIADVVRNDPATVKELDFFTTGWMGLKDTFDMEHVCKDTAPGATFEGKLPVIVSYVAAFYAKRVGDLKDCNAPGAQQDLCTAGAGIIQRDLAKIVAIYESYAQGFAACYGTTRPIVFEMEPDFFQYTISNQQQAWTPMLAGQIMSQFVGAMKKHLPNAHFSMDISPWVPPDNGSDGGKQWFSNFDMSLFTFVNTSGGHTDGGSAQIRQDNKMTWSGVSMASGKPVLADTGYGVNGRSEGPDAVWNDPNNINARIKDGVVSLGQYNPS
jgi:hypothetical protein